MRYSFLFFFVLTAQFCLSQSDYSLFRTYYTYFYQDVNESPTKSPYITFQKGISDCSLTHYYNTLDYQADSVCNQLIPPFNGLEVCHLPDETSFLLQNDKTVIIKQQASVGETWPALLEEGYTILGKVDSIVYENLLGELIDSVKYISFRAEDEEGNPIPLAIDNESISISKDYGLIKSLFFRDFPDNNQILPLAGLRVQQEFYGIFDFYPYSLNKLFDFENNDEIHLKTTTPVWTSQGVAQKYVLGSYTLSGISKFDESIHMNYNGQELTYFQFDSGEFGDSSLTDASGIWSFYYEDLSLDFVQYPPGAVYRNSETNLYHISALDYDQYCDRAIRYSINSFSEEFDENGFICYELQNPSEKIEYYYQGWGGPYYSFLESGRLNEKELIFSKRNGISCGEPLDFSQIIIDTTNPYLDQELDIFPNPTSGDLTIALTQFSPGMTVALYDMLGRRILSKQLLSDNTQLNMSSLPKGVYIIHLQNAGQSIHSQHVVKQ